MAERKWISESESTRTSTKSVLWENAVQGGPVDFDYFVSLVDSV